MSREAHGESVAVALAEIHALEHRIMAAQEKQQEALGAVVMAVGDPPTTDSGRTVLDWTVMLDERLSELLRFCDNIGVELNRYAGGF